MLSVLRYRNQALAELIEYAFLTQRDMVLKRNEKVNYIFNTFVENFSWNRYIAFLMRNGGYL
jgi:hypothetical protein